MAKQLITTARLKVEAFLIWQAARGLLRCRRNIMAKLIVLTHEFAPFRGGVATYCEELAAALHRAGVTVEVWAPDYGATSRPDEFVYPVVRQRAGGSLQLAHMIQFGRQLVHRRSELEPATVLLASVGAHMAFMFLMSLRRVRCDRIFSLLHGSEVLRFQRNPIWRSLAQRFFPHVCQVFTVSRFSKELIEESFLSELVRDVVIAPCAPGSMAARPVVPGRRNDEKIRILTLARLHPRKGQLDTAQALARLPRELRERIVYQVGGSGDVTYRRQVEKICRAAAVAFEPLGEVSPESIATTYEQCDIYAMTSRALPNSVEGFGITYLEAGFHGKPVVGYCSGGVPEAVIDGETGVLVPEGNSQELTEAFQRLITDANLRRCLGEAGRKHAAKFSWHATAAIITTLAKHRNFP
jgi:phosphatidylinositol alpha-1,6-mannosyltransferase